MTNSLEIFLNFEVSDLNKSGLMKLIEKTIETAKENNQEVCEISLNVCTVVFYPNRNQVLLTNDVDSVIDDELMAMDTFIQAIRDFKN